MQDMVHKPVHYNSHPSGIECREVNEHAPTNIGAAMKYLWRCGLKDAQAQELEKCLKYINMELERISLDRYNRPGTRSTYPEVGSSEVLRGFSDENIRTAFWNLWCYAFGDPIKGTLESRSFLTRATGAILVVLHQLEKAKDEQAAE